MLIRADARHIPLADGCVQCVITSPPYFGLRDYGDANQIGLEPTLDAYVQMLVSVFREVRRVLTDSGTVWLVLGDSYVSSPRGNAVGDFSTSSLTNPQRQDQIARPRGATSQRNGRLNADEQLSPNRHLIEGLKPKDLIGIPWRVAFALQQPYTVPTCVKREIDRAWLAAMFDGEGRIGIRHFDSYREEKQQVYQDGFVVYTVVTNNDIELLDHCATVTGFGKPALKQAADSTDGRGIVSRRDSFGWRLDGNKAVEVVAAIYPYLIAKKRQACLAYTLDQLNKNGHGSRAVPAEVQEKKRACYEMIKRCNQRENVDLPSWVEEPKQIVEPGWYLRSDIVWHKPNPTPESVTDRPTKAHEYVFLLSKSAKYYYDAAAIAEDAICDRKRGTHNWSHVPNGGDNSGLSHGVFDTRNRRTVWTIPTMPYSGAHFATFPEKLVEPCILAGCPVGGLVLDPFVGSGTVGAVAERLGRRWVGTDLSYQNLAQERTVQRGIRW